jgi:hypothetical protein
LQLHIDEGVKVKRNAARNDGFHLKCGKTHHTSRRGSQLRNSFRSVDPSKIFRRMGCTAEIWVPMMHSVNEAIWANHQSLQVMNGFRECM